ncbi:MAG: DUF1287 domain-containing protein [Traorella sp.]
MKKVLILFLCIFVLLYYFNLIPHVSFSNQFFHIETYISKNDQDLDGVDDQSDIFQSALDYVHTRPKYQSKYYGSGYPDDEYGVCSDVVGFALLGAGYDLQELVYEDIIKNPDDYQIDVIDKNIDFRRVSNLLVYFKNHAFSLTTDLSEIEQWHAGDIVIFPSHIGILSNKRNYQGIPFLIHHGHPFQLFYEEDVLEKYEIIGHYRMSE